MKNILVRALVVTAVILCWLTPSAEAQLRQNQVVFWYYAHDTSWWTGLAIINNNLSTNQMRVEVFGSGDNFPADESNFSIKPNEHWVETLDAIFQSGTIPAQGYMRILGTQPFHVTEFIGRRPPCEGLTKQEKSSEPIE